MQFLRFSIKHALPGAPILRQDEIIYWDDWMSNPWAGRNPQPDCKACGRGHIRNQGQLEQLQHGDVAITCECGASFRLTEAFRHAIKQDRTAEAAHLLMAEWVEMATIQPKVPSIVVVPFRTPFARLYRVEISPSIPIRTQGDLSVVHKLFTTVYWIALDGFVLLSVWAGGDAPDGITITYSAYGSLEFDGAPDWVRTIHSSRRLEIEEDWDAATALLGVATEAFARQEFMLERQGKSPLEETWRKFKESRGGLSRVLRSWCEQRGVPEQELDEWQSQVWDQRNLTFHESRATLGLDDFREALDVTLRLIFSLRPAAMLELSAVQLGPDSS
ncbi:MAG: hypothetical protein WEC75_04710 [Dehalococcoidia bacterium]